MLLDAGITVITTVNVQHLESLNDVVYEITGVLQRETVPDAVVRQAEQIELADMTPEALRRRLIHGNVYAPDKVDAALGNYFRVGNLTALRELALPLGSGQGRRATRQDPAPTTTSAPTGKPANGWSSRSQADPRATPWFAWLPASRPVPRAPTCSPARHAVTASAAETPSI